MALEDYVGKNIKQICDRFHKGSDNHCAHFVSHVLGLSFGMTCKGMVLGGKSNAANLRVQEIFPKCGSVKEWEDADKVKTGLVFVTSINTDVDIDKKYFENVGKKHIGILFRGNIYHYSNSNNKVIKQTPDTFFSYMTSAYGTLKKFYGSIPTSATGELS
ncbi:hypothetical protein [Serratia silvae]|uniref:NlpC/P60 domain-containing protein n=2 Tax=Serratia silvae TaxID=2824122 RepID=A0ABT0KAU3_9GAMM|nr:hypothetical protein [Serratia silvae]MCL1029156.1 hypothetical protein [Serratia silvae]